MTDRDKIIALAEAMGWKLLTTQPDCGCIAVYDQRGETLGVRLIGPECNPRYHYYLGDTTQRWNPLTNISDAFEVQAAIAMDKKVTAAGILLKIVSPEKNCFHNHLAAVMDATALQRSDAILLAYGFEVGK